jgi:hypothetical protein
VLSAMKKVAILVIELSNGTDAMSNKDIENKIRHELKLRPQRVPYLKKVYRLDTVLVPDLNLIKERVSAKNKRRSQHTNALSFFALKSDYLNLKK